MYNHADQNDKIIRPPAVAGQFYPLDADELNSTLEELLSQTPAPDLRNQIPQILILPHAGYIFSGPTAAYGYKAIQKQTYQNVILIGSSHNFAPTKLSLYAGHALETPLGNILINQKINNQLSTDINFVIDNDIHLPEHSLEVQLPFLQKVINGNWQAVLGLINNNNYETLKNISNTLYEIILENPQTLIIISSDLSHYPKYKDAVDSDQRILNAILTKDPSIFSATELQIFSEHKKNLYTCACAAPAIKIGMLLAAKMQLEGQLLNYTNSGHNRTYGDKKSVVGYGALVFSKKQPSLQSQTQKYLSPQEQSIALKLARHAIALKLHLIDQSTKDYINYPIFYEQRGLFVTLRTKNNSQLRGCIGSIEPAKPLAETIFKMAQAAAFNDHRFSPLKKEEFNNIQIEISVLTPPEKISDPYHQIQLGEHGVIVRQGQKSGIYLPSVATETGWSLEEFMESVCVSKAGLPADCWKTGQAEIYTFKSQTFGENK